jgi:UDP-3-O-[3-hydroxymyristoyl] N-acetylglucosamine deacetylase
VHVRPGPIAFLVNGVETQLRDLVVEDADRATVVRATAIPIATVEHLLAACAGLGLHDGLLFEVHGGEVPLLDGAALVFARALRGLAISSSSPSLTVTRDETLTFRESRYAFHRGRSSKVAVSLSYDDPRVLANAVWAGDRDDFVSRIAGARTFAFADEVAALVNAGHASHVDPASVVVLAPDAILVAGAPFTADEPARHKLLDLMGDLFLYGGPPLGGIHAHRPGHRATHAILREALASGVIVA